MASAALSTAVAQWLGVRVSFARRIAGVKYPDMYAEGTSSDAIKFNCIQRAHQNMVRWGTAHTSAARSCRLSTCATPHPLQLEYLTSQLAMQMLLGLAFPCTTAALGVVWCAGRVSYALGYSTGDPSKRAAGSGLSGIIHLGMFVACAVVGVRVALGV